jgi:hypothetical protein
MDVEVTGGARGGGSTYVLSFSLFREGGTLVGGLIEFSSAVNGE